MKPQTTKDKMMGKPLTVPLSDYIKNQIELLCDAYGKGFDQFGRDLENPYAKDSALHYAYEYGKERASSKTQTTENPSDFVQYSRRDGTTTRQLKAAPNGAIFIVPNQHCVSYTRNLASDLGRPDIKFDTPNFFRNRRYAGLKKSMIVIDHATPELMSKEERDFMYKCISYLHD